MYKRQQYDILTAYSGQEALKKVVCKPDLILLDINMPGMDGLTAVSYTHLDVYKRQSHASFEVSAG